MIHAINKTMLEGLKHELQNSYPTLKDSDFQNANDSVDALIESIAMAVNVDKNVIRKSIDYIQSKSL